MVKVNVKGEINLAEPPAEEPMEIIPQETEEEIPPEPPAAPRKRTASKSRAVVPVIEIDEEGDVVEPPVLKPVKLEPRFEEKDAHMKRAVKASIVGISAAIFCYATDVLFSSLGL